MAHKPTFDWAGAVQKSLQRHERPDEDDFLTASIEKVLADIRKENPLLEVSCRALMLLDLNCIRERLVHALSVCNSDAEKALCIALIVVAQQRIGNSSSQVGDIVYGLHVGEGEKLLIEHAPIHAGRRVAFRLTLQVPKEPIQKEANELVQRWAIVECDVNSGAAADKAVHGSPLTLSRDRCFSFSSTDIAKDPLECAIAAIRSLELEADHQSV
jgi:hypothetical protein